MRGAASSESVRERHEGVGERDEGVGERDEGVSERDEGVRERDEGVRERDEGVRGEVVSIQHESVSVVSGSVDALSSWHEGRHPGGDLAEASGGQGPGARGQVASRRRAQGEPALTVTLGGRLHSVLALGLTQPAVIAAALLLDSELVCSVQAHAGDD